MTKNSKTSAPKADTTATQEQPVTTEATTETQPAPVDPFADVPVTRIGDEVSFHDLSDVECTQPYKYATVHAAAQAERSPMMPNYKHGKAVLIPGTSRKEYKKGSVYGDIQHIVNSFGRAGVPVYVLITELRKAQVGNKRSKYCEKLPPHGWAEGWLNTALTKSIVGIHPSKTAPSFRPEAAAAEPTGEEEQKKIANG